MDAIGQQERLAGIVGDEQPGAGHLVEVLREHATQRRPTLDVQCGERLVEHINPNMQQLITYNFSTNNTINHTTSDVIIINTFKHYFKYQLIYIYNIPQITLKNPINN